MIIIARLVRETKHLAGEGGAEIPQRLGGAEVLQQWAALVQTLALAEPNREPMWRRLGGELTLLAAGGARARRLQATAPQGSTERLRDYVLGAISLCANSSARVDFSGDAGLAEVLNYAAAKLGKVPKVFAFEAFSSIAGKNCSQYAMWRNPTTMGLILDHAEPSRGSPKSGHAFAIQASIYYDYYYHHLDYFDDY